jgi:hypothetical protein
MLLPLTVTAGKAAQRDFPAADVKLVMSEYAFDLSAPLVSGRRSIRVENAGTQPHHVAFVRLGAGRSLNDFLASLRDMQGPRLDHEVGGTTAIAPGGVNVVTADFEPGEYALICFIPDTRDGVSHMRHGMVRQITVR